MNKHFFVITFKSGFTDEFVFGSRKRYRFNSRPLRKAACDAYNRTRRYNCTPDMFQELDGYCG